MSGSQAAAALPPCQPAASDRVAAREARGEFQVSVRLGSPAAAGEAAAPPARGPVSAAAVPAAEVLPANACSSIRPGDGPSDFSSCRWCCCLCCSWLCDGLSGGTNCRPQACGSWLRSTTRLSSTGARHVMHCFFSAGVKRCRMPGGSAFFD